MWILLPLVLLFQITDAAGVRRYQESSPQLNFTIVNEHMEKPMGTGVEDPLDDSIVSSMTGSMTGATGNNMMEGDVEGLDDYEREIESSATGSESASQDGAQTGSTGTAGGSSDTKLIAKIEGMDHMVKHDKLSKEEPTITVQQDDDEDDEDDQTPNATPPPATPPTANATATAATPPAATPPVATPPMRAGDPTDEAHAAAPPAADDTTAPSTTIEPVLVGPLESDPDFTSDDHTDPIIEEIADAHPKVQAALSSLKQFQTQLKDNVEAQKDLQQKTMEAEMNVAKVRTQVVEENEKNLKEQMRHQKGLDVNVGSVLSSEPWKPWLEDETSN